jgi:hypothetical protein
VYASPGVSKNLFGHATSAFELRSKISPAVRLETGRCVARASNCGETVTRPPLE